MSKRIKPFKGQPAKDFLVGLRDESEARSKRLKPESPSAVSQSHCSVQAILNGAIPHINPDTCLNDYQVARLKQDIERARYSIELQVQRKKNPNSTVEAATRHLTVLVNSYRLECENCLRADCNMRDPDAPVLEVRERMERHFLTTSHSIGHLKFERYPERIMEGLRNAGIHNIGDLCAKSTADILNIPGLGRGSLKELRRAMNEHGFELLEVPIAERNQANVDSQELWTIYELDFSHETCDLLHDANLTTLDDLRKVSAEDILGLPNSSRKVLKEVELILAGSGVRLSGVEVPEKAVAERISVTKVGFSERMWYALASANIYDLGDLSQSSEADLLKIRGFGEKSLEEAKLVLFKHGLALKEA